MAREVNCDLDREALQEDLDRLVEWSTRWQLGFNRDKCKVMHIGGSNIEANYRIGQWKDDHYEEVTLKETKEEKDMGVWTTNNLKCSVHVTHVASKANQILGLIKRSFTYRDKQLIRQLYTTMVRPHLEYANVVWHPYYKKDIELLEQVQHRATRIIPGLNKLKYEERLQKIELPSLVYRRLRGDAIEMYKYLHGIYKVNSDTMLPLADRMGMELRGHNMKFQKRHCNTALRANVFGLRMVNFWNSLPSDVVNSQSVNEFKGRLDIHCVELSYSTDLDYEHPFS